MRVNADGTAVIGAGAQLIDIYTALAGAGRCLLAGTCPSVGIAGLTLGGGIGMLSRKFGLTCDRLVSATVVTADGTSRIASASAEPELFWALRGGGRGNFGVVISVSFDTVPAPKLTVFSLSLLGWPLRTSVAPECHAALAILKPSPTSSATRSARVKQPVASTPES